MKEGKMDSQLKLTLLLEIVKSNLLSTIINNVPTLKGYEGFLLPFVLEEVEKKHGSLLALMEQDLILNGLLEQIDVTALRKKPESQKQNIEQVINHLKTTEVMARMEKNIVDHLILAIKKGSLDTEMKKKKILLKFAKKKID